ncbi:MAG TPA: hypothetical protein VNX25_06275 [Verrucomicrobiae bacterium]|nr:hypothetical protein [Verrucomicrobiae bacterium]
MLQAPDLTDLDSALQHEYSRAGRYGGMFCLIFLKMVGGTAALPPFSSGVEELISRNIRTCDRMFHYADSEYMILLPNTSREGGACVASKLKKLIEEPEQEWFRPQLSCDFSVSMFPAGSDSCLSSRSLPTCDRPR